MDVVPDRGMRIAVAMDGGAAQVIDLFEDRAAETFLGASWDRHAARDNARAHYEYANQRYEGGIGSRLNALRARQEQSAVEARVEEAENDKLVRQSGADSTVLPSRVGGILMADSVESSHMAAYVMAVDSPYFAVSDEDGSFTIAGVPPGTYTYHAWRPGGQPLTGSINVDGHTPLEVRW